MQHAVRAARESGLPLSVRGGGHDWAGRAIRPGGLVIDLTRMRQVSVRDNNIATVAGGATSAGVAEAADRHGLAAATGTVGSVEVALHPLTEGLAGSFTFPWEQAEQVLRGYGELLDGAPDELTKDPMCRAWPRVASSILAPHALPGG